MWYVIKTDFGKEHNAKEELSKVPQISARLPLRRVTTSTKGKKQSVRFKPLIDGILFIHVLKKDTGILKAMMKGSGFFIHKDGTQYESNAHLLSYSSEAITLDERLSMAKVPEQSMRLFSILNSQKEAEKSLEDVEIIDSKTYKEIESEYDTVCMVNGPFFKFQGVIRQVKRNGKKDHRLFIRTGSCAVSISNIRKFNYLIVREAPNGENAKKVNTWRFIDYLIGKLQATYFTNDAGPALRNILLNLSKGKAMDDVKRMLLVSSLVEKDNDRRNSLALQAAFIENANSTTESVLEALNSYFINSDESVSMGLKDLVPNVQLRPFLTPTPGKEIGKDGIYTLLEHKDFTEIILNLDLTKVFIDKKYKFPYGLKPKKGDFTYYAHIGVKKDDECKSLIFFVNWSGFMDEYHKMEKEGKNRLKSDMIKRGHVYMPELLNSNTDFYVSPELAGFKKELKDINIEKIVRMLHAYQDAPLNYNFLHNFKPIIDFLKPTIHAAVEMWQISRLTDWYDLAQRYVLLHKLPTEEDKQSSDVE
ncbi:MAG: hypothetical protein LKF06_03940 [Prevotella sp.]|jgi:transcription antitermination factor NusG|nr:hypothetical protein [Prevotella sp.]